MVNLRRLERTEALLPSIKVRICSSEYENDPTNMISVVYFCQASLRNSTLLFRVKKGV